MDAELKSQPLSAFPTYLRVVDVLANLCRRDVLHGLIGGVGRVLLFIVSALLIRCTLDYWLHFTWTARAALLATDAVAVSWIVWRFMWQPFRRRLTRDSAALHLQSVAPELQSRLIATLQLVAEVDADRAPRPLVEKLLMDTAIQLESVDWKAAVPLKQSAIWLGLAFGMLSVGVLWAIMDTSTSGVLVPRYFLSAQGPILQTQLDVVSGDLRIPRGSVVILEAVVEGEVPRDAVFDLIDADGMMDQVTVSIEDPESGQFQLVIENAQQSFSYRISAGDAVSRIFEAKVLDPPTLDEFYFTVTPPAYTGLDGYVMPANALQLVEGATVRMQATASDELAEALVYFYPHDVESDLSSTGESLSLNLAEGHRTMSLEALVVEPAAGFLSVDLIGVNGVQSVNDTCYPIRWVIDQRPVVTLSVAPTDGETVAAGRSIRIAGDVSEDYTLETLQFCYEIHQADAEDAIVANSMPVSFAADTLLFDLNVSIGGAAPPNGVTVDAPLGGSIQWWFEAIDNCALSDGPHVTQTERVTLPVISVEEKIAELMGRVRDGMSTIEQVSDRQSEASERLSQLTRSHISNNDE